MRKAPDYATQLIIDEVADSVRYVSPPRVGAYAAYTAMHQATMYTWSGVFGRQPMTLGDAYAFKTLRDVGAAFGEA